MKKILTAAATLIAVLLATTFILPIAACKNNTGNNVIKVTSMGNYALAGVDVKIYDGDKESATLTTNADGEVKTNLNGQTKKVTLHNLPLGYSAEESYTVNGNDELTVIKVASSVIAGQVPSGKVYNIGDVIYDFEIQEMFTYADFEGSDVSGRKVKLSDVLKEKRAVMLNFFYVSCYWCQQEYPSMRDAYNNYKDKLEILAIDNYPTDNSQTVANNVYSDRVPYFMGMDSAGVVSHFPLQGYPTSFMIDRYGVICWSSTTILEQSRWESIFAQYTADDYSQDINGETNNEDNFVPEKPADHGAVQSPSSEINGAVNKTNKEISWTSDSSEWTWPWRVSETDNTIYPTNLGYRGTHAIAYAEIELQKDQVLTFEYNLNTAEDTDVFYVAVDAREGLGKQTYFDSGIKNWQKGYAYIPLEAGKYEISFIYYRNSVSEYTGEEVSIRNIHFENISDINTSVDMPYFAARGLNIATGAFTNYSTVYKDSEGYYRVSNQAHKGVDPYLFVDMHHATPYFTNYSSNLYNNYILNNNCKFGNKDYYDVLDSYNSYANNSEISGLVPVREDIKEALTALYNSENATSAPHYSANGWLEFCTFYKHYGTGDSIQNPIEGVAYFSAFEAHETTNVSSNNTSELNHALFERVYMPRGLMFKFVPDKSGAYMISGASKTQSTDAWLYDGNMTVASEKYPEMNSSGMDDFDRYAEADSEGSYDNIVENFRMYNYLEAGKTYYIMVAFHIVEDLGTLDFRIDYIGENHYYLSTVTAGFYTLDTNNKLMLPVYADVAYNEDDDVFYDRKSDRPIYCDMTQTSRMFNLYSVEKLVSDENNGAPKGAFNLTGRKLTLNGKVYEGKDYTAKMREYVEKSKQQTGELYGMVEVDFELQIILRMFYDKTVGTDTDDEWLKACWYYVYVGADS